MPPNAHKKGTRTKKLDKPPNMAKAKTINKYLGSSYEVLASFGHVRDLPAKDGSVNPDDGFAMTWEVAADSRKHIKAITEALKTDDHLILATDPDREGEAISWHLQEALASSIKKGKTVSRVTFNAITKDAVTKAMKEPRQVDVALVDAYLARRALDYLVGFTLSPVLWRKLPGAKSAGRVQSVCLRLIVEREMEIEAFRAREFWTVAATFKTPRGQEFEARLTTRYMPKRHEEMAGGSLYWILDHTLVARSTIRGFSEAPGGRWHIELEPVLVRVEPRPKRAHQGWRCRGHPVASDRCASR